MKYLFVLWMFLNLTVVACNKDHDEEVIIFPDKVQQAIDGIVLESDFCYGCNVEIYELDGRKYYNLYCSHWSCAYCNLYDEDGNEPSWDDEGFSHFLEDKKLVQTVPMCKDS